MSRYLYKKIQNISPESLNFQHSGLKLTTLGSDPWYSLAHFFIGHLILSLFFLTLSRFISVACCSPRRGVWFIKKIFDLSEQHRELPLLCFVYKFFRNVYFFFMGSDPESYQGKAILWRPAPHRLYHILPCLKSPLFQGARFCALFFGMVFKLQCFNLITSLYNVSASKEGVVHNRSFFVILTTDSFEALFISYFKPAGIR